MGSCLSFHGSLGIGLFSDWYFKFFFCFINDPGVSFRPKLFFSKLTFQFFYSLVKLVFVFEFFYQSRGGYECKCRRCSFIYVCITKLFHPSLNPTFSLNTILTQ